MQIMCKDCGKTVQRMCLKMCKKGTVQGMCKDLNKNVQEMCEECPNQGHEMCKE